MAIIMLCASDTIIMLYTMALAATVAGANVLPAVHHWTAHALVLSMLTAPAVACGAVLLASLAVSQHVTAAEAGFMYDVTATIKLTALVTGGIMYDACDQRESWSSRTRVFSDVLVFVMFVSTFAATAAACFKVLYELNVRLYNLVSNSPCIARVFSSLLWVPRTTVSALWWCAFTFARVTACACFSVLRPMLRPMWCVVWIWGRAVSQLLFLAVLFAINLVGLVGYYPVLVPWGALVVAVCTAGLLVYAMSPSRPAVSMFILTLCVIPFGECAARAGVRGANPGAYINATNTIAAENGTNTGKPSRHL